MGRFPDVFRVVGGTASPSAAASRRSTPDGDDPAQTTGASSPTGRIRWGRVLLVSISGVVSHIFGRATIGVLLPAMTDDLGFSDTLAGTLSSANMSGYLAGVVIVTFSAGRIEPFTLLRAGIVATTVGVALVGVAPSAAAVLAGTALAGLGGGGIWLTAPVIASEGVPPERRGAALGVLTATMGAAFIGVPVATAALRNVAGSDAIWRPVWLTEAALSVLLLLALSLFVRAGKTEPVGATRGFGALRQIRGWKRAVVAYMAFAYTTSSFANFLGLALERDHGFGRLAATLAFSAMGAGSAVGSLAFGRLSDRMGRPATMSIVMAISACTAITLALRLPSTVVIFVAVVAFGGASFSYPSLVATFVNDHAAARTFAAVLGTMTMFYGPASVAGPAVSGWLADRTASYSATYGVIAAMALLACVCMLSVSATNRNRPPGLSPPSTASSWRQPSRA